MLNPNDTLIIGGKKVVVERVITYDTIPEVKEPTPDFKKPKLRKDHLFFFQAESGLNRGQLLHESSNLMSVAEMIGNSTRNGIYFKFEMGYEKPIKGQLNLKAGIGILGCQVVNYSFDTTELDDSLFRFESFAPDQLSQITRWRFDIGTETDTVPVNLVTNQIEQFYLSLPLQLVWAQGRNQNKSHWQRRNTAGLGASILYALNTPNAPLAAVSKVNDSYEVLNEQEYNFKKWVLAPNIFIGQRWLSKKGNSIWIQANASFPFSTIETEESSFYFNQQWLGLSAGLNIFLP